MQRYIGFMPIRYRKPFINSKTKEVQQVYDNIRQNILKNSLCHIQTNILVVQCNKKLKELVSTEDYVIWIKSCKLY